MRLLERSNPDVQFDWPRLLKESSPPPAPRHERDDRIRERRERRDQRPGQRPPRPQTSAAAAPPLPPPSAALTEELDAADQRAAEHAAAALAADYGDNGAAESAENADQGAANSAENADARRTEPEPVEPVEPLEPDEPASPASDRLGPAGVKRLRDRYTDLLVRLAEKEDLDEAVRIELKRSAERLNPDAWRTPEEVAAALEGYEAVFEYLRSVVGRHTRRPK